MPYFNSNLLNLNQMSSVKPITTSLTRESDLKTVFRHSHTSKIDKKVVDALYSSWNDLQNSQELLIPRNYSNADRAPSEARSPSIAKETRKNTKKKGPAEPLVNARKSTRRYHKEK